MSLVELRSSLTSIKSFSITTRAMRLLAMSLHAILKSKNEVIKKAYQKMEEEKRILFPPTLFEETPGVKEKTLTIFVGSQRGLCGAYNNDMVQILQAERLQEDEYHSYGMVGEKLIKKVQQVLGKKETASWMVFEKFTISTLEFLYMQLMEKIERESITIVNFWYTKSTSIFSKTIVHESCFGIIPSLRRTPGWYAGHGNDKKESWESFYRLFRYYFMYQLFYNALLAEQSARFISMDTAYRNANDMISIREREYNKMRQKKITEEIQDLVGTVLGR